MKLLLMSLMTLTFVACSGGGNGDGSPAGALFPELNHNELAETFVQELNLDAEFNVSLAKRSTLRNNFVVIYDPLTDSFDALNIDNYNPNLDSAAEYYFANSSRGFFDLDVLPAHYETQVRTGYYYDAFGDYVYGSYTEEVYIPTRYRDRASGFTFEKVEASAKDLAKMVALQEAAQIQKSGEFLSSEFGLSLNRAKEIATLQAHWKKASKKGMTNAEVDAFSTELLGFSLSNGIDAYQDSIEGNSATLDSLVEQSAATNGITPEHATQLMTKVFGL